MNILIINPNTSTDMSKTIDEVTKKYASQDTVITTINPTNGPAFIANAYQATSQAVEVVTLVERSKYDFDYFIIACGVDPGLEACRSISKNVIGTGESSIMTACAVAGRFSVLAVLNTGIVPIFRKLDYLGIDKIRCSSVRVVGNGYNEEVVTRRHEMIDSYYHAVRECIEADGAEAVILMCAGMSDLKEIIEKKFQIPIIVGSISAVKTVEQFTNLSAN